MYIVEPIKSISGIRKIEEYPDKKHPDIGLIFAIGINTGLRVSDILNLKKGDVQNRDFVQIREQKTKKYKRFILNDKLQRMINAYLTAKSEQGYELTPDDLLFSGARKNTKRNRSTVYTLLNEAAKETGLTENIGTHTMRKTFGYHIYKKTKDIALVQKLLNHSSPDVTLRYIGITQDVLDDVYRNFIL